MILWYITIYIILEYMSELLKKQTKSYWEAGLDKILILLSNVAVR